MMTTQTLLQIGGRTRELLDEKTSHRRVRVSLIADNTFTSVINPNGCK